MTRRTSELNIKTDAGASVLSGSTETLYSGPDRCGENADKAVGLPCRVEWATALCRGKVADIKECRRGR